MDSFEEQSGIWAEVRPVETFAGVLDAKRSLSGIWAEVRPVETLAKVSLLLLGVRNMGRSQAR